MRKPWPKVKLGEVLNARADRVQADPMATYKEVTVRLWGKGVVERGVVSGSSVGATNRFIVRHRDFVLSKIDARNGALGLVPPSLDGALVSSDFPTFVANGERLLPEYLGWRCRAADFVETCRKASEGTTNRVRLKIERFLSSEIPLPPLEEQRRIVNYLDTLSTKITQARTLRHQSTQQAAVFYAQVRDQMFSELRAERKAVGEVFDLVNGRAFKPEEWQDVGRKIIRIQNLKYATVPFNRYAGRVDDKHLVHCGDVLFAWSGQVVSLGAHIWRDDEAILNQHIFNVRARTRMLPEFVREGLNALVDDMKTQVRGLEMFHIRKQELVRLQFPVPALPEQRRIVAKLDALQAKVDALKQLQADTEAELTALQSAALDRAFKGEL